MRSHQPPDAVRHAPDRRTVGLLVGLIACGIAADGACAAQPSSPDLALRDKVRAAFVLSGPAQPQIGAIDCPAAVPQFARLEVRFQLDARYANPFDPDEVDVVGRIVLPDGREACVPAFYMHPYAPDNGLTQLSGGGRYHETGPPGWRLRFAGSLPGEHRLTLVVKDAQGHTARSAEQRFTVTPAKSLGFVRVSPDNPKYFENTGDGSLFFGCGANVAWTRLNEKPLSGTPSYEYYFGQARQRMSATRVWICHWAWLEWMPRDSAGLWQGYAGLGYYNQMLAATFDRVFEQAEAQQLRVMLTLEDNDEQMAKAGPDSWAFNPYNRANGGFCGAPAEFFGSPDVRRWYQKRLRYILARWGSSPSLWALNGWNDYQQPTADVTAFLRQMRDYVHVLVGAWRPMIYGANFRWEANAICDYAQGASPFAKPDVVQECYFTDDPAWFRASLRSELWRGLAEGLGAIMVWPHVEVDRTGAWDEFAGVLRFVADLPLHRQTFRPCPARVVDVAGTPPACFARVVAAAAYGDVPGWGVRAPKNAFTIDVAQSNQWLEGFCSTLYSTRRDRVAWRNPPTLHVDLPAAGKLLLAVEEIGAGQNALSVAVDGAEAQRAVFDRGRRTLAADEQWVEVPLPAGPHAVTLDNVQPGGDWLRLRRLYLVYDVAQPRDVITVRGLCSGRQAFFYLENGSHGQFAAKILRQPPVDFAAVVLEVPGLDDGTYDVTLFDPAAGKTVATSTATSAGGRLRWTVPRLSADAAIKFRKH